MHSSWTTASFQTAEPYPHPTNLRVLSTSYFSAVLAWDENGDAKAWQLCLNDDEEHLIEAKNNQLFTLRGLESDKGYAVKVRAVVEEGSTYSYTRWSDAIGVYTDNIEWERPSGIEVAAKSSTATISWQGSSDSYTLNYWTAPKVLSEGQSEWKTYGDTGEVPGINFNQWYNFVQVAISPELTGVTEGTIFECDYYAEMAIGNENFSVGYSTTTAEYDKTGVFYWNDGGYLEEGASGYRHFQTELPEGVKYVGISFLSNYNDNIVITNVKITSPAGYWESLETNNRQIEIGGLERGCTYECQVVGHKEGLADLESEVATFTTEKNSAFSDDFAVSTTATSARISWDSDFNTYKFWYRKAETPDETVYSANFNENMDGWTVYTKSTETSGWQLNSGYKHGGSGSSVASINLSSDGCDDWLITPKIPLYGYATFYVTGDNYPGMYEVRLSTTGTNRQDFTTVLRDVAQAPSSWEQVMVYYDNSEYMGKEGYIAIRHRSSFTRVVAIDDFEAKVYGNIAGEWQNIDTDKTEVLIEGLEPNTKYEYFVYGYQWDGETTSVMSDVKNFTTAGDAVELALSNNRDNTEDIMMYDGVYANVRIDQLHLKKDGKWQTICLPFDVDVERSVLKDATVRTIESMRAKNGVLIVNCLTDVTQMKAGTPYIIRWNEGEDIQDPVFNGVTIVNNYPNISLEYSSFSFFSYYNAAKPDWISFLKLGEGGMVVPFTMEDDMYAFSAYFFVDEVYQASMDIEDVILNTGDNEDLITGLENLKDSDDEKDIIYNVAGQRLQKMQRGINIVGGKKVLVK